MFAVPAHVSLVLIRTDARFDVWEGCEPILGRVRVDADCVTVQVAPPRAGNALSFTGSSSPIDTAEYAGTRHPALLLIPPLPIARDKTLCLVGSWILISGKS